MLSFHQAQEMAIFAVKSGEILNYFVEKSHDKGLYITFETEQGWNPEPWWQEFDDENIDICL